MRENTDQKKEILHIEHTRKRTDVLDFDGQTIVQLVQGHFASQLTRLALGFHTAKLFVLVFELQRWGDHVLRGVGPRLYLYTQT